jgi:hypothetical protein
VVDGSQLFFKPMRLMSGLFFYDVRGKWFELSAAQIHGREIVFFLRVFEVVHLHGGFKNIMQPPP